MAYPKRVVTDRQREVIRANTQQQAAKILGISKSTVQAICKAEGIKSGRGIGRGGLARGQLCDDVRSMWAADYSVAYICNHYDLRASAVCGMLDIVTLSGISLYLGKTVLERVEELADDEGMSVDWTVARLMEDHPLVADAM
jgi:hypothetical protein